MISKLWRYLCVFMVGAHLIVALIATALVTVDTTQTAWVLIGVFGSLAWCWILSRSK